MELELCPKCEKAYLKPTGRRGTMSKANLKNSDEMTDYECEYCGHKLKHRIQTEHAEVSDRVSATKGMKKKSKGK